ncbi:MAG TPA: polyhydroxyalkanoate synthesis regulator DNA-binding domain-containing protein [Polyangiaceae bacterium]|nr:polyhydroxyalkanoate synthesis regulator DNA-binding domain-containing protein [Polyangiaceae bacterium]
MTDVSPTQGPAPEDAATAGVRVIKRYSNRKLYDTIESRYVTLLQIAEMVRDGIEVQIIDNATKEDKTEVTLALIISEELKDRPRGIPLATLKTLIRSRGGKLLTSLREGPLGKLMAKEGEAGNDPKDRGEADVNKEQQPGAIRRTIEQWQQSIDERIRAILPDFSVIRELQAEVKRLNDRVAELENERRQGGSGKDKE